MQNKNTSTNTTTVQHTPVIPTSESRAQEPRVHDSGTVCISAAVKIFDPESQEIFLEMRA